MSMKSLEMAFYYLRYGQFDSNLMLVQPVSVKWSLIGSVMIRKFNSNDTN